ncbi:hypothetical protein [Yinghuangia soli]|uniref:Uncharacterized protein n=1 Tax=Yinghuangia soli TaxID=2908204 RepID=A0AA41TWY0_9ACTN|nr:hypothetical protein [Yinghuangia soli]MCF2526288.1 hypothetical protein [Yinghuangia soli]
MDEGNEELSGDSCCVLDAVICVHFVGANLHGLLIDVLAAVQLVVLVPEEVVGEVAGKGRKYRGLEQRWKRLVASRHVRVLPRVELATGFARVIEVIEDIRETDLEQAVRQHRDLGEVVVVAHAVHLAEQGVDVKVLIDDHGGQRLAARWGLEVLAIEDILTMAVELGFFPNAADLVGAYAKLRAFGDGMLPFEKSGLKETHALWKSRRPTG